MQINKNYYKTLDTFIKSNPFSWNYKKKKTIIFTSN